MTKIRYGDSIHLDGKRIGRWEGLEKRYMWKSFLQAEHVAQRFSAVSQIQYYNEDLLW